MALAGEAGLASVNVDLIIGGATETDADLVATLDAVLRLEPRPTHVSAYALTVEPGTPLARDPARHPDDDVAARRYELVDAALSGAGYRWYEVSNWAVPGHECRHNSLYWAQGDYRGIGCAAHSHRGRRRWWNIRTPERYIEAVRAGRPTTAAGEVLSDEQATFEGLALALRTSVGVPASVVPDDPDLDGLLERRGDRAVLSLRGRLLANEVTVRLHAESVGAPARPRAQGGRCARECPLISSHDRGHGGCRRARGPSRPGGTHRQPVQAARVHLPLGRDLRGVPLHLRLRAARRHSCCATSRTPGGARWSSCATTSSASTPPSCRRPRSGRPRATWPTSPTPSSTAATATSAGAPTRSTAPAPTAGRPT